MKTDNNNGIREPNIPQERSEHSHNHNNSGERKVHRHNNCRGPRIRSQESTVQYSAIPQKISAPEPIGTPAEKMAENASTSPANMSSPVHKKSRNQTAREAPCSPTPRKRPNDKRSSKNIATKITATTLGTLIVLLVGAGIYYKSMLNLMPDPDTIFQGEADMAAQDIYEGITDVPDASASSIEQDMQRELDALQMLGNETGDEADNEGIEDPEQILSNKKIRQVEGVKNYLVIGVDSRSNNFRGRSDAMMIVSVNTNTKKINMMSLFRSTSVNIPSRGRDSLNHSYAYGGAKLLKQTIETNFRLHIDDYVIFNFTAFRKCIDVLGGIRIWLSSSEARVLGLSGAGTYNLNGSQALSYSRIRSIDSDFQRTGRQRKVVNAVMNKLQSSSISKLNSVISAVLPNVSTSLSHSQITGLLPQVGSYLKYERRELLIPSSNCRSRYYNKYGHEMWSYKVEKTVDEINNFLYK